MSKSLREAYVFKKYMYVKCSDYITVGHTDCIVAYYPVGIDTLIRTRIRRILLGGGLLVLTLLRYGV